MPAEAYGVVLKTFWTDPDIKRKLTRDQKHLFLYLCTSPHSNMIGVYYCPIAYMANEADLSLEEIRRCLSGALAPHVTYDEQTEEVFVHALAKHGIGAELKIGKDGKPDRRIEGVRRQIEAVHSPRLRRAFIERYGAAYHLQMTLPDQREAPSEPLASPLLSPSEALAVAGTEPELISSKASPSGAAREQTHGGEMSRGELLGRLRKVCAPRNAKIAEEAMRSNADIADRLAKVYTYAELAQAAAGRRARIERGEIPSMPPGCGWTLRVWWDKEPIRNQVDLDLGAYHAMPPPTPELAGKRGGTSGIAEVLDFTKFARGA